MGGRLLASDATLAPYVRRCGELFDNFPLSISCRPLSIRGIGIDRKFRWTGFGAYAVRLLKLPFALRSFKNGRRSSGTLWAKLAFAQPHSERIILDLVHTMLEFDDEVRILQVELPAILPPCR